MKDKEKLQDYFKGVTEMSDEALNANLNILTSSHANIDFCSFNPAANNKLTLIEAEIFDRQDYADYWYLLGRKPISYQFRPDNRHRAEAIFAILNYSIIS